MREVVPRIILLRLSLLLLYYVTKSLYRPYGNIVGSASTETDISLLLAPSPLALMPFTNNSVPNLSGLCMFNFSSAESILRVTANDCWSSLAPYLANAVCCPQYEASLVILLGQSSHHSGIFALNETQASHCISDLEKILESHGANENLHKICSIAPSNLTGSSCPIVDVDEVDIILAASTLVVTCDKIDMANECCNRICKNAVSAAAEKLALRNYSMTTLSSYPFLSEDSAVIKDCENIVLRWLATKLDPTSANGVLRGLSSCNLNEGCPLAFPDIDKISKECGTQMNNQRSCCDAMESYMSQLQEQSFVTNLQALNCAFLLGIKLQSANISRNIYNLCHIHLKDFSLQVDSKESGCLLPSLPSDVTFDESSGIGFICDLNDNVAAPWPSGPFVSASSCNKHNSTTILPDIPKATSAQIGMRISKLIFALHFSISLIL